ncbi:MAG: class I SAM-dependent methyltransferase, partial [Spirochaetota bacterium]|nr:class I SAM-dependent methyltransferase [Spirochaetota bacterium]
QTITKFFGVKTATELVIEKIHADLLLGNNVLAHVPDINDFVKGMKIILKPKGIITMEFPHLMQLMDNNQFDTIYHEHFSYLSLLTVEKIFAKHALTIFDVEELFTHGGSLRIFATHKENNSFKISPVVETMKTKEIQFGLNKINSYVNFSEKVKEAKRKILKFLISLKQDGMSIVAYGAPAKANTLLNYCGIGIDFIDYTVDISPYKQGLLLPGTRIPIFEPERIKKTKPNYILILPWNIKDEIIDQMSYIRDWGGKFIILIPEIEVLDCEIY